MSKSGVSSAWKIFFLSSLNFRIWFNKIASHTIFASSYLAELCFLFVVLKW